MNHSFIISRNSIIGRNMSELVNSSNSNISVEMRRRYEKTPTSDDPYFRVDDPNVDPINIIDVLKAIPMGKFHILAIFFYFTLFLSTSTLAFNFAFFLMPQAYKCPYTVNLQNNPAALVSTAANFGDDSITEVT